jgi:anti-sigma regulatory factor (Ser/Thr protein kinase)
VSTSDELVLDSELAAMSGLGAWVDALAVRHGLPEKMAFAAKLCLEEAVSNSIRHGYGGLPGSQVRVRFSGAGSGAAGAVFTVEDDAPPFNPLQQPELPAINPVTFEIGGQGIRLMRAFAASLDYEATATGNRLRIGFAQTQDVAPVEPASL